MNYNEFLNTLTEQLSPMFPTGTIIEPQTIPKNNGVSREALVIHEPDINVSPTIYLEDYYTLYTEGMSIDELCHIIYDVFLEVRLNHPIDPSFFTDFEKAKHKLIFQVINYAKNAARLPDIPHIPYLDLAIVFCCMIRLENGEAATILIRSEHLLLWNTDLDTIKKQAFDNTPRLLPAYIQPITEAIHDLIEDNPSLERLLPASLEKFESPLYVLTNETQYFGAACMFYPALLSEFAENVGKDLYILPSSIHEVLLLPVSSRCADAYLSALVRDVNQDQLPETQILSNTVYYYSKEKSALVL